MVGRLDRGVLGLGGTGGGSFFAGDSGGTAEIFSCNLGADFDIPNFGL